MIEISEEKEKKLLLAIIQLKVAGMHIGESASNVTPFKASKFLNVLMKEVYQIEVELRALLNRKLPDTSQLWNEKQSTYLILKAMYEDGEFVEAENR